MLNAAACKRSHAHKWTLHFLRYRRVSRCLTCDRSTNLVKYHWQWGHAELYSWGDNPTARAQDFCEFKFEWLRELTKNIWIWAHDFRTALLKVEDDVNVLPSRYLFSPLILCLILRSSSSALSVNGESDACHHRIPC